jgi:hypothetical protein
MVAELRDTSNNNIWYFEIYYSTAYVINFKYYYPSAVAKSITILGGISTNTYYCAEVDFTKDASNGGYAVYWNGNNVTPSGIGSGLVTNGCSTLAKVYIGAVAVSYSSNAPDVYVNNVVVADSYIGMLPSITRVQGPKRAEQNTSSTTSVGATLAQAPSTGNMLILAFASCATSTTTVSSISQSGVTWTQQAQSTYHGNFDCEIWAGIVGASPSASLTVNFSPALAGAIGDVVIDVCEYSGLAASNFLDKTASANSNGSSTATSTGTTATTTRSNELWIGAIFGYNVTQQNVPTNGFNILDGNNNYYANLSYLEWFASLEATASAGTTLSASNYWCGCIATFIAGTSSVPINVSDSGVGSDVAGLTASIPANESGAGVETPQIGLSLSESGVGVDLSIIVLPVAESGYGSDVSSVYVIIPVGDAGSGVDSPQISVIVSVSDVGAGTENGQVHLQLLDSGSGIEIPQLIIPLNETGHGTDLAAVLVSLLESGVGADSAKIQALISALDSSVAADFAAASAFLSVFDSGLAVDQAKAAQFFVRMVKLVGDGKPVTLKSEGSLAVLRGDGGPVKAQ